MPEEARRRPSRARTVGRWAARLGLVLVLLAAAAAGWGWWRLRASLPPLEGESRIEGLHAPVTIERDALGVPVLRGGDRRDVAAATGFVHGQERFFQMDLFRRRAAGELSELFGRRALAGDAPLRIHRLRDVALRALAADLPAHRELVEAYAAGVNAGLASLAGPPFEYLILRAEPAPWAPEDSYLVLLAMFLQLQDEGGDYEATLGLLHDRLPAELFRFLAPRGTEWDSAIDGTLLADDFLPPPTMQALSAPEPGRSVQPAPAPEPFVAGSNAWAVAGTRTADGRALLANDMHLGLGLPTIWYRAVFVWPGEDGASRRVAGITLPGAPPMVSGSNGHVAWGFSNAQVDTSDVLTWEADAADAESYSTPDGREPYRRFEERIAIKDGTEEPVEVTWTRWGPLLEEDHRGRKRAIRWVAHDPTAVNLRLLDLEDARSVEQAVEVANRSGIPAQNFLVADRDGRIAWTVAGRLPRRVGFDGRLPGPWSDGSRRWDGWLPPSAYPRVVDPEAGLLWSGNQRMVGGPILEVLGDGGFVLGARAGQIRDRLRALEEPDEEDMLALQLDDEALFLGRWRDLLLEVLTPEEAAADPRRREALELVERWNGHASVDSAGYQVIRQFRIRTAQEVFDHLTRACVEADPEFVYRTRVHLYEGPLWRLVTERPRHLLDPRYGSWDEQLLGAVDGALDELVEAGGSLAEQTWGRRNTLAIHHPFAGLPLVGGFLRMPPRQAPGDNYMPRVQHPSAGASERLVVSPGHEGDGFFHMPGGQSGHPLSDHFGDHQDAWVEGSPTPFLPGEPVAVYTLRPAAGGG